MVTFQKYMSVALNQCGNDESTFAEMVDLWNRETDRIREMSEDDLRRDLECP